MMSGGAGREGGGQSVTGPGPGLGPGPDTELAVCHRRRPSQAVTSRHHLMLAA